jgi:hypothetical protein
MTSQHASALLDPFYAHSPRWEGYVPSDNWEDHTNPMNISVTDVGDLTQSCFQPSYPSYFALLSSSSSLIHESYEPVYSPHILLTGPDTLPTLVDDLRGPQNPEHLLVPRPSWISPSHPTYTPSHRFEYIEYYDDDLDSHGEKTGETELDSPVDDASDDGEDIPLTPPESLSCPLAPLPSIAHAQDGRGKQFYIDEDDDELPPLDAEWCNRAGMVSS